MRCQTPARGIAASELLRTGILRTLTKGQTAQLTISKLLVAGLLTA
jgi:hypothetical protein